MNLARPVVTERGSGMSINGIQTHKQNDGAAGFSAPTCEIPLGRLAGGGETLKRLGFPEIPRLFWLA